MGSDSGEFRCRTEMSRASGHQSRFPRARGPCATGHLPLLAAACSLPVAAVSVVCFSICLSFPWIEALAGSAPGSAFGAQPPKNEFAFPKHPLAERGGRRPGHVVPVHVLDTAAAVAEEVVMRHALRVEARLTTSHGHFTHQTG